MLKEDLHNFSNVFRVALQQKKSMMIFLLCSLIVSLTEAVFLWSLYVLFSADKKILLLNWLKSKIYFNSIQLSFIERNLIYIFIGLSILILLLRLIFAILSRFALAFIQTKTFIKLSNKLLSCFIDTHPLVWAKWRKEKILNTLTYEAGGSAETIYTAMNILLSIGIIISLIIGAFVISARLTIFCIFIGISVLAANYLNYAKAHRLGSIKIRSKSQLLGHVYDVIFGHKILKLEGGERIAKARMSNIIEHFDFLIMKKAKNINVVISVSEIFIYFFFFGLVIMANIFKILDQAVILTFLLFVVRLQGTITDLQSQWMAYQELLPNFIDVQKMLIYADEHGFQKKRLTINYKKHEAGGYTIKLDNVSFSYVDGGQLILNYINVTFSSGQRFLIKGVSGSGKSTFINLLCGILRPTKGKIYFNDEELTEESFYNFRNYISYSAPEAYIFRGTLKDNISLGLTVTEEEIAFAIRKAGLEEFTKSLDNGIYSIVVDNASNISLGERQRLMLARMFLKNPMLILLDEATSNLDLDLEDKILKNLVDNLSEATLIMVTHRAPKNFNFDKRFELKDGKLIEI